MWMARSTCLLRPYKYGDPMIIRPAAVAVLAFAAAAAAHDPDPKQMERSFTAIARRAMPASVAIRTYGLLPDPDAKGTVKPMSHGSGFFVSPEGHILTNAHVVDGAERIVVILGDGTFLDAELVGRDDWADLALLKVDAGRNMPVIPISESGKAKPGMWAFAVGNPRGVAMTSGRLSFTVGTVTGRRDMTGRLESDGRFYGDMIEADLSIWPGSSGGPLLNSDGEATGVVSAMSTHGEDCDKGPGAIAYAIPLDGHALRSLNTMLAGKPVRYSLIGVSIISLDPETRSRMHLRREVRGVLVTEVPDGMPAAEAGIAAGDIIVSFGGEPTGSTSELIRRVAVTKPGSIMLIGLLRRGKALTLRVVPTAR